MVNKERLRKMKERYDLVEHLREEVAKALRQHISDEAVYKELLAKLMVQVTNNLTQSMLRLMERNLYVKARSDQVATIKTVLPQSEELFTRIL